jgi:uncharacterized protein involved in exopolysaccharide biosynthesis
MLPSLRDIASRVFRKKLLVGLVFFAALLISLATGQFKHSYKAQMTVLVRKERVDAVLTAGQNSTPELQQLDVSEADLNSEVELLKTPDLLQQVVVSAGLLPEGRGDDVAMAQAVRKLQRNLNIEAIPKTEIIVAKYSAASPRIAQLVLSKLGELYLKRHQELRDTNDEILFLDNQVQEHKTALESAEGKLLAFTQTKGIISAAAERDAAVQQMETMAEQDMETRAAIADAQQRTSTLNQELGTTAPRMTTTVRVSENPQLLELIKSTLLTLQLKRSELLAKFAPQYRLVQNVDAQIAIAEKMLADQTEAPLTESSSDVNPMLPKLRSDVDESRAELDGLRAKQKSLAHSTIDLRNEAASLAAQNVEQDQLLRDVSTEQDDLKLYKSKREQAKMAASLDQRGILNVVIAQPAMASPLPERSTAFVLLAVLFTGLILGVGAAFLADLFDPTVRYAAELEEILGTSVIEEFEPMNVVQGAA